MSSRKLIPPRRAGHTARAREEDEFEQFKSARDRLRKESMAMSVDDLKAVLSSATYFRLKQPEDRYPSHEFSSSIRRRLIWLSEQGRTVSFLEELEARLGALPSERSRIIDQYRGRYHRYRMTALETYVHDELEITSAANGEPIFHLWGHDGMASKPEVTGNVLLTEDKLWLMGQRRGVMFLAVVQTLIVGKEDGVLPGLQLSTNPQTRAPVASKILLVPDENDRLRAQLDPREREAPTVFSKIAKANSHFMQLA